MAKEKKVCIKAHHPQGTISNMLAVFHKGNVYTVPASLELDPEAFDTLEIDGVPQPRPKDMDINQARAVLAQKAEDCIKSLVKGSFTYNDANLMLKLEQQGERRKNVLGFLVGVPELVDYGTKYNDAGMWASYLTHIPGLFANEARIVSDHYTKEQLLSALREGSLKVASVIEDKLRKHFKIPHPERVVLR